MSLLDASFNTPQIITGLVKSVLRSSPWLKMVYLIEDSLGCGLFANKWIALDFTINDITGLHSVNGPSCPSHIQNTLLLLNSGR